MFHEDLIALSPKNEILKRHIAYYYFYETFNPDFEKQFSYYPHYRTGLTIDKDSEITWNNQVRTSKPKPGKTTILFTNNIKTKRVAHTYGVIKKICVAFEPLGINHFLDCSLSSLVKSDLTYFNHFGSYFLEVCDKVFDTSNPDHKVEILDQFFLSKYQNQVDQRMMRAVDLLLGTNEDIKIQYLAQNIGVDRKTLNRLFQKNLCCSPNTFRQIVKFRKAFHQFQEEKTSSKLSQLAYENKYCDQPGLIKHFKKLTGAPPKTFFSNINHIDFDIYWTLNKSGMSQMTN